MSDKFRQLNQLYVIQDLVSRLCVAGSQDGGGQSMAARLLTLTSRHQPARTKCASPSASLASVLFTFMSSALLAWRASRQTIGKPSAVSAVQSQVVNGPVSSPIRT